MSITKVRSLQIGDEFILCRTGDKYTFVGRRADTPSGLKWYVYNHTSEKLTSLHYSCKVEVTKTRWARSTPPSIGWWPVINHTTYSYKVMYRWWDGSQSSVPCDKSDNVERAEYAATLKSTIPPSYIMWLPRPDWWPERSKT